MPRVERIRVSGARRRRVVVATLAAFAPLFAVAGSTAPGALAADAKLTVRGSAEQVQVTDAKPGQKIKLQRKGRTVDAQAAGKLGGVVFRDVDPRGGYQVKAPGSAPSRKVRVFTDRSKPPSKKLYDQQIPESGYGYLETRDGTELAVNVSLPSGDGPYPTLVEYSGYGYANPDGPQSGIAPVATLLGFAVVDVNMRGTGCSGGAFDYFEPLQSLDGYDIVETVARQPWVKGGKVGMMGVSYGGISQLFVAAERPPSLAAITPLSVIDNTQTTLYPGGILNTGFALNWAQERVDDSQPATATTGQEWAYERIQGGDETCKANQDLHPEAVNLLKKVRRNRYYRPKIADPLSPETFVKKIDVPVFGACQWTDEQTGGHCPTLVDAMTGTDKKWFTFTNGTHIDSLDPETFNKWFDFLKIYVAEERPDLPPAIKGNASLLYSSFMGIPGVTLPDDPIQSEPDLDSARSAFESQRTVRVLFDNGAGGDPGYPYPAFEKSFNSFPPPKVTPTSWYLASGGELSRTHRGVGADEFTWDPDARPPTDFTGNTGSGDLWTEDPSYEWSQNPKGSAVAYVSSKLGRDTTVLGAGEVQAWVRSEASNVDLQATVTEVRRDGNETFVQSGWLRTEARKVDRDKSSLTEPVPNLRKRAAQTLPEGHWAKVRIPLYYQGHVYRKSSRLRVVISAPGGDQPIWAFGEASPDDTPWVAIKHSRKKSSRLVLPVAKGMDAPTALPPCPGLRGEPCRDYRRHANDKFSHR